MKRLAIVLCLLAGSVQAQQVQLDCARVPAYTADLERLLEQGRADPSIWRLPTGEALRTIRDRLTGNGAERAQIQREQYEAWAGEIRKIMWTVREQCPGY